MTDLTQHIDTVPSTRFPVYTRLNAGDVMPDPITPLGATLVWIPEVLPGWASGYMRVGSFTPRELDGEPFLAGGFYYGYLYVNQTAVRLIGIRAGIGSDAIDAAFFAHPNPPPHQASPSDVNEELSAVMAQRTQWTLTTSTYPELEEERELADRIRAERPNLATATNEVLIARARSIAPLQRLVWGRAYNVASGQASIGPGVITSLVGAADPTLTIRLIGSAGEVDSALPSFALWDLSREVRADTGLTATFDAGEEGLLDRLRAEHPAFATRFDNFVFEFGYRGPSEWDPGMDSWETKPELPLSLIGRLRYLEDDQSPVLRREARSGDAAAALQEALALLADNQEAIQTLHLAIASARRFGAWRERGKTNAVKLMHEVRIALYELGRRLAAAGELDHPRQIFMALESELDMLATHAADYRERLREREKEWRQLFAVEPPTFVVGGEPMKPVSELLPHRGRAVTDRDARRGAGRRTSLRWRGSWPRPGDPRPVRDRGLRARRDPRCPADRSVLDPAVHGLRRRRRRCWCDGQPRDDRQPGTRHSVRGRRAERDEPDPDRNAARGGRLIRKGHRPRRLKRRDLGLVALGRQ